ncbi:MAG: MopE-related protein [Kofleriaceae bacterium]
MSPRTWITLAGLLGATLVTGCPDGTVSTVDSDGDKYTADEDCDDGNASINPGATEICGDGIDNDCDGDDAACSDDLDGDGYTPGGGDCDDADPNVNPGAAEDCTNAIDDDCNGIATACPPPTLIYTPIEQGTTDAYGVAVFADRIVFGDPAGVLGGALEDGRAAMFTFTPGGYVTEADAVTLSAGEAAATGAYGIVINPVAGRVCVSADYHDYDASHRDAGKSWCFSDAAIRTAGGTLALSAADFTTASSETEAFAAADAELDTNGDGLADLAVYASQGIQLIQGTGGGWSGDYVVPVGADQTIACGSPSYWCGFARAYGAGAIAMSGAGGPADTISIYALPLPAGAPTATATYAVDRGVADSAVALRQTSVFAIGSSTTHAVYFVDTAGTEVGVATGPRSSDFGEWVDVMTDQDGHELLLVGAPGAEAGRGRAYVFDLTSHGLPTSDLDAIAVLAGDENQFQCGFRARGGIVTDADGVHTTVAISCPSSGGAAFQLDSRPLPPPLVRPADVGPTTPAGHYNIRRWVVTAFTGNVAWAMSLAQVEAVFGAAGITGWRLRGIAAGSPLYRAGLRDGDVLKKVNDTAVTSPAVVRQLVTSLSGSNGVTVRFTRAGQLRTYVYHVVP